MTFCVTYKPNDLSLCITVTLVVWLYDCWLRKACMNVASLMNQIDDYFLASRHVLANCLHNGYDSMLILCLHRCNRSYRYLTISFIRVLDSLCR